MLLFRINLEHLPFISFLVHMSDHNHIESILNHSYEAVLFNGSWQHSVALVVNMLPNDVDPSWCSGNELRFFVVSVLKVTDELVVPCLVVGRI